MSYSCIVTCHNSWNNNNNNNNNNNGDDDDDDNCKIYDNNIIIFDKWPFFSLFAQQTTITIRKN